MDETEIGQLRTDGKLLTLESGAEAVPISVQFEGELPAYPRAERKQWLLGHFQNLGQRFKEEHALRLEVNKLSLSGQSVEGVCSIATLPSIRKSLEASGHRLRIITNVDATLTPNLSEPEREAPASQTKL